MKTTNLFRNAVKNPITVLILFILVCHMTLLIIGDINHMQEATTGYEYCKYLCYLIENVSISYFMSIFFTMLYLTYVQKQYSKWTIRLFYVLGVSSLVYFGVAGHVYDYVFHAVESKFMENLPSLARTVFTGPVYWIIIDYFFIPKILKDAQKMKEEQDLTI